jgi:hypothetical protein
VADSEDAVQNSVYKLEVIASKYGLKVLKIKAKEEIL